ncbi:phage tail protein [Pseudomonas sp. TMW22090]|uniref:phage tail protein n=1 Tax=Pseudomonas sp. TMW22090 TaxID=2506434 RepID=UPI001F104029|nr:phage tail protein [Pseudomonas sp. TMW22090]
MKEAAASAAVLLAAKESLVQRNTDAALRITRINDRIETLSYGIEAGEASEEDEAEQALLQLSLKAWKGYKFALGKVTIQATWPASPVWPLEPAMPDIPADPEAMASETQ